MTIIQLLGTERKVSRLRSSAAGSGQPFTRRNRSGGRCAISACCKLQDVLGDAVKAFYAVLDRYTLADITRNRQALAKVLLIRPERA